MDPAFQLDFMGEESSQHPLLTPNPFPKCLGMEGGGGEEVGRGEWRPWEKADKILPWLQEQGWCGDIRAKDGWHV